MKHRPFGPFLGILGCVLLVFAAIPGFAVELRAGTAKAVISPAPGTELIGVMGEPLKGVENDIHARVLTLHDGDRRMVLLTYDLNCLDVATPLLRERLRDELGIDPALFIPLATHNHAAPIQIVPGNFEYGRWLAGRMFALVQEAMAAEAGPVRLWFGQGHEYSLRALGNAPIDYEVQALKVTRDDRPVALFFNHPTHPLQSVTDRVDPGHPGHAAGEIEARLPGVLAMFGAACGGNQFTLSGMSGTPESVGDYGRRLADAVLGISGDAWREVTGPLSGTLEVIDLPLAPPLPEKEARKLAKRYPKDIGFVPYPHKDRGSNWVRSLIEHYDKGIPFPKSTKDRVCTDDGFLVREYETPRAFPCVYEETIVARLGELVFVAMQGEVCAPIGMRVKDAFRAQTPILVTAYMGEHNLYIPTREIVRLNLYQAKVIQDQYASPVGWDPSVEDRMVSAVRRMVDKALKP
ncbi:MAG: hypothetical protein H3C30_13790 [Candidatus Hydrogenedentes bacterium]|nr:hypothetical protein [Candidatus Hydrogenedentota bacterium]